MAVEGPEDYYVQAYKMLRLEFKMLDGLEESISAGRHPYLSPELMSMLARQLPTAHYEVKRCR